MEFEQKAEEKKMSMSKNIARLAVTAGLTAALSFGGVMAPVTMAFAAEGTTAPANSITINKVADENATNTFKAYQIFKAKVDDVEDRGKVASDIKWANGAIGRKVITAIQGSTEYKKLVEKNSAELLANDAAASVVAEWLSQNVKGTAGTASGSEGMRVAPGDVLYEIAAAVSGMKQNVEAEAAAGDSLNAGTPWTRPDTNEAGLYGDGYYLFVSDGLTDPTKPNTGTSPIFAIVGGDPVVVTEKTSIPTVVKKIKDDKPSSNWADKADSQMGQKVHYQLKGTVADNVATFGTYYYEFHDELSAGLTADASSVKVTVYADDSDTHGTEIKLPADAVSYNQDGTNNLLTVKFSNLKAVTAEGTNAPVEITASSKVVVTYTASLDSSKVVNVGGDGNPNSVKLIYSNNPMGDGKGESVRDTVRDYTYALRLVKEDAADENTKLDGVKFTIKATDPDDTSSKDKYVNDKGNLVDTPFEFETKNDGVIEVKGLDAGTYTVKETHTLGGYNTLPDFTFKISTAEGDLAKPEGESSNTLTVSVTKDTSSLVKEATVNGGVVNLTVQNKKGSGLPLTGLNGVTFTWIAGGAVLCIGVAHLIRSRKQAEESEQE